MGLKNLTTIKTVSPPFGLDISDLSLKLVCLDKSGLLKFRKKKKVVNLLSYNQIPVPEGYFYEGKIIEPEKIIDLIKKLVKETKSPKKLSSYVISVLPETKAFIKLIEIPNVPKEKIPDEIANEIKNHFPFSPNEIYLDWQILPSNESEEKLQVLVSVAPKEIADSYTNLLLASGLKPYVLEIESSAICRALLSEEITPAPNNNSATALIDLGATRTSLIFYEHNIIQFTTSIPFSGQRISEKISQKLKISLKEAEKAKIKCGLSSDKCQGVLGKILKEDLLEMLTKIKNSLVFYENNFPQNKPVKKIIICGGGANFEGLKEILEKELNIKVELANPLLNINVKKNPLPKDQILGYTTAIGLALRGALLND